MKVHILPLAKIISGVILTFAERKQTMSKSFDELADYLHEFEKRDFAVKFESVPRGDVPAEAVDYHLHKYWEVKFCTDPDELYIHPPQTIHCDTENDLVFAVTHGSLRISEWVMDISADENVYNFLPELLDTLHQVPSREEFSNLRYHLCGAVISNIRLILEKLQWYAESDLQRREPAERCLNYLENHYFYANLSVTAAARFAGISPQQLNVLLKRKNGMGIRQNLIRIRLEHAAELLEDPACTVKDAAALTGWKNPFYFSNSFRRHFGCSPGEYRRAKNK